MRCAIGEPVGYAHEEPQPRWIPGLTHLRAIDIQGSRMIGQYNLWHQSLRPPVDEVHRFVGQHIDKGTSLPELRTRLRDALASGELAHPNGKSMKRVRNLDPVAQSLLSDVLNQLRTLGLLI